MILASECQVQAGDLYVVGVSGGADSICLLHALHHLGNRLLAVHINHHLRPEADQEALFVAKFARDLGVDYTVCQVDVPAYAAAHSISIEEAARSLRYACLFEQAEKVKARAVMVAHNADDQVETILMHILRGSGLTGLRGMEYHSLPNPWSERLPLLRPLLSTPRAEILAYTEDNHLDFVTDASNLDVTYMRNRVRHALLPYLEGFNPRLRQNLLRMGQLNREDYALLQGLVNQAWQVNYLRAGPGYVALRLNGFRQSPASVQRYLLRMAIAYHLPSLRDIDFDSIQRGIEFLCDARPGGQVDLVAGLRLLKEGDTFWLATWQADLPGMDFPSISPGAGLEVSLPSSLALDGGWVLLADLVSDPQLALRYGLENGDPFHAWFDVDELELPLIVRSRKTGERMEPLGMQGHSIKLSDLMVNLKIPQRARSTWPLLCSGRDVIWVPGCRQGQLGQVRSTSRRVAHLSLLKSSGA